MSYLSASISSTESLNQPAQLMGLCEVSIQHRNEMRIVDTHRFIKIPHLKI